MRKSKRLSRNLSDRIYSSIIQWRENLFALEHPLIVVEGKRDVQVLNQLGFKKESQKIIMYSQLSRSQFEDIVNKGNYSDIVLLTDFDPKGNEYISEIKQTFQHANLNFRNDLYALTNGRIRQFEHLLKYLKKQLHESYWVKLLETIESGDLRRFY